MWSRNGIHLVVATLRRVEGAASSGARGEADRHGVTPRPAATVIVLRGGDTTLELLMVQRTRSARFMGGAWVFPGGALDPADGDGDAGERAAAIRELAEEAGIDGIDPASLVRFSRWVTPPFSSMRFDTHFFLAPAPEDCTPTVDGTECVDFLWITPADALEATAADRMLVAFPTSRHLEQLTAFASANAALEHARGQDIVAVEPRIFHGEYARIVLPGEPGYEA
jgi:8-oxo-dGTP pyrophosphatase MutT (NUDIX family)